MRYCRGMGGSLGGVNFLGSVVRLQQSHGSNRSRIDRRIDMVSVTQPWVPHVGNIFVVSERFLSILV